MLGAGPAGRGAAGCCRSPPAPLRRCWPGTRPAQIPFCEGRGRRAGLERRARSGRGVEQGQGVSGLPDRPRTPAAAGRLWRLTPRGRAPLGSGPASRGGVPSTLALLCQLPLGCTAQKERPGLSAGCVLSCGGFRSGTTRRGSKLCESSSFLCRGEIGPGIHFVC